MALTIGIPRKPRPARPRSETRSTRWKVSIHRRRFWTRQTINITTTVLFAIAFLSIWFDNPHNLATAIGLVTAGLAFALLSLGGLRFYLHEGGTTRPDAALLELREEHFIGRIIRLEKHVVAKRSLCRRANARGENVRTEFAIVHEVLNRNLV